MSSMINTVDTGRLSTLGKMEINTTEDAIAAFQSIGDIHDDLEHQLFKSRSYYRGRIFFKAKMSADIDVADLYSVAGVGETQSTKDISLYERSLGVAEVLEILMIDPTVVGIEIEILTKYHEALQTRPSISEAFNEVTEFKISKNKHGATDYLVEHEARLYADAVLYFGRDNIKLKEFKEYLRLVSSAADWLDADPWDITYSDATDYLDMKLEEVDKRDVELGDFSDISKATITDEEYKEAVKTKVKSDIEVDYGFKKWYAGKFSEYKGLTVDSFINTNEAVSDLEEEYDTWVDLRRKLFKFTHSDTGGKDEYLQVVTKIDALFDVFKGERAYNADQKQLDASNTAIFRRIDKDFDVMSKLYDEYKDL